MAGWHHWCEGHELGQTLGDGKGQGGLACCSPWDRKMSHTIRQLNNSNSNANGKNPPATVGDTETGVQTLGWEDPLEEIMETHSSIPAWRIPWVEEPGGLQSMDWQRVRYDWSNLACANMKKSLIGFCKQTIRSTRVHGIRCKCPQNSLGFTSSSFSSARIL